MVHTKFGIDLKKKLLEGIEIINKSVGSTLGPSGRNVLIHGTDGIIRITKDGVTVAASFSKLNDPIQDIGAQLLKQVSLKAADKAGDGTTTATVLASKMIEKGISAISQNVNPIEIKKGMDLASKTVVDKLREMSQDITDEQQLIQVATISANNDDEIGKLLAEAMNKVGVEGVVTIEDSYDGETKLDTVEGMQFDRGYKSPYFVTDNNSMQAILEDPYILIYEGEISKAKQIIPIMESVNAVNSSLLIIATDIVGEALATLIVNKGRQLIKVAAVKAPDYGDRRLQILQDIAVLTGGTTLHKDQVNLEKTRDLKLLGRSRKVNISKDQTTIIEGKGDIDAISQRITEIKAQLDNSKSNFETETLQNRLAKMTGGIAVVYVGGGSQVEVNEKKDRVDDAMHATRAALEEGIVPGGGIALLNCLESLDKLVAINHDQSIGIDIVKQAIKEPFRKILENAGIENQYEVIANINHNKANYPSDDESNNIWEGYNVKTGVYENFFYSGVIDPTKVTRTALENAVSVAGTILTTESVVYLEEDKKKNSDNLEDDMY